MSQALRKLTAIANKSKTCIIFINQLREKVGVMFGNPEVTAGGKALKFYASVRIDVRKADALKDSDGAYGNRTKAKIVKNKVAPPFKEAEFDIMYGRGISHAGEIIDLGIKFDIVKRSGAWISYNDEKIAQGRDNAKVYITEHPEVAAEIEAKIREKLESLSLSALKTAAKQPEVEVKAEEPVVEQPKRKSKINIDVDVE
jgi:recombination protein RecA